MMNRSDEIGFENYELNLKRIPTYTYFNNEHKDEKDVAWPKKKKWAVGESIVIRDKQTGKYQVINLREYKKWLRAHAHEVDHHEAIPDSAGRKLAFDIDGDDKPLNRQIDDLRAAIGEAFAEVTDEEPIIITANRNRPGKQSYHVIVQNFSFTKHGCIYMWEKVQALVPHLVMDPLAKAPMHLSIIGCVSKGYKMQLEDDIDFTTTLLTDVQDCKFIDVGNPVEQQTVLPAELEDLMALASQIPYIKDHSVTEQHGPFLNFKREKYGFCRICNDDHNDNTLYLYYYKGEVYERCTHDKRHNVEGKMILLGKIRDKEEWIWKSDEGLAEQFRLCRDDIRVVNPESGTGYVWCPKALIWEPKTGAEIANLISPTLREYIEPLRKGKKEKALAELERLLKYVGSAAGTRNIFTKVRIIMLDAKFEEQLNSMPTCVPIQNGQLLDLKTMQSRRRTKADMFSFVCPVKLVDDTKHAERFMREVFPNKELCEYVTKLMGLSMTTETLREFYILYGESASNGKTTLTGLLQSIMGKWAAPLSKEVFIKSPMQRSAGSHTSYLMPLVGIRAGISSEIDEDEKFDVAQLKKLSGNDIITARGCYERKEIGFRCYAKMFLCTNHIPEFNAQDAGILDRLVFIPFESRFVDYPQAGEMKRDKEFIQQLQTIYLDEVFTLWAHGAFQFYQQGLKRPAVVQLATRQAAESVDHVGQFITDMLEVSAESKLCMTELFTKFTSWAFSSNNEAAKKVGKKSFTQSLKQRKLEIVRSNGTKLRGYKFKDDEKQQKMEIDLQPLMQYA